MDSAANRLSRERSIRLASIWILGAGTFFLISIILTPSDDHPNGIVVAGTSLQLPALCQFKRHFGFDCPGCGLTRSFIHTARFRWAEAWSFHPIGAIAGTLLAISIPHRLWQIYRWKTGQSVRSTQRFEIFLAVSLAVLTYLRWLTRLF